MFDFELPSLEWRHATLPKKSGGVRHIKIPNDALKQVQRDILQYLYQLYYDKQIEVASFAHGFVPFRNTCTSLMKHDINSKVFLCMDVEDFFDNFPIEPVREKLLAAGIGAVVVDKIITACTCDGHFPQGSPASPWLTNIGMLEVDKMLSAYAAKHGFTYTRYADDITFGLKADQPIKEAFYTDKETGEVKRYYNPYKKIFKGINAILSHNLGLHLKAKKNHIIFRGSRNKPVILGVTLRQDNKGFNAEKTLRMNTRAAVHQLAMKIRRKRGRVFPEDKIAWAEILGTIQYMDYVRSFSLTDDAKTADPVIQEKHFNYLMKKMGKSIYTTEKETTNG